MEIKTTFLKTLASKKGSLPLWLVLLRAVAVIILVAAFLVGLVYGINALKGII